MPQAASCRIRSLARILRVYNRLLVTRLRTLGHDDFFPALPPMVSNLDVNGTRDYGRG